MKIWKGCVIILVWKFLKGPAKDAVKLFWNFLINDNKTKLEDVFQQCCNASKECEFAMYGADCNSEYVCVLYVGLKL